MKSRMDAEEHKKLCFGSTTPDSVEEPREGILTVYDHEGRYVGCIGSETWQGLVEKRGGTAQARDALIALWDHLHTEPKMDGSSVITRPRIPVTLVGQVREAISPANSHPNA